MKYLLLLTAIFFISACQTSEVKYFQRVQTGMEKDQVVDLMGSPVTSQRVDGVDKWTYRFYGEGGQLNIKEVDFLEGRCTYVGEPIKPALTAEERDRQNEALNKQLDEQDAAHKKERQKAFSNYQSEQSGEGKVLYVPKFVPVN